MSDDERAAEILADWYDRRERGESNDPKDVVRAHPDVAAALEAHFAAQAMFDKIAGRASAPASDAPATLGEFRILRELGRGGMGVVYEAEQTTMRRRVALKVLFPSVTSSRSAVERFQREARAAGRLHHTNIVPVHSMGEERGVWFYAMELVVGRPLDQVIEDVRRLGAKAKKTRPQGAATSGFGTSPGTRAHFERVALAFAGVAEGLEAAHAAGIVHRDVKPSNLVLDTDGTLRLMDFGLARVADDVAATRTGEVIGTPSYMSPEQVGGTAAAIDARTDVYSLGATLYEALTLHAPFHGASVPQIFVRIQTKEPRAPRRVDPRIPRDLETIVQKAMEKELARRYADAGAMAQDLRLFAADAAIRARRVGPAARAWRRVKRHKALAAVSAAAAVLAIVAAGLWLDALRGSAARRELRYAHLFLAAQEAVAHGMVSGDRNDVVVAPPDADSARALLSEAIDVAPDRPDAWLLRGLCPGTSLEQRLADMQTARDRGLGQRTYHLGRAYAFQLFGKRDEQAAEQRAADSQRDPQSAADLYVQGQIALTQGRPREAIDLLTESLRGAQAGGFWVQAHFARALARQNVGELGSAIEDLAALREAGDSHPTIRVHMASLWRRLGDAERAEAMFSELFDEVRAGADPDAWQELCAACRSCYETKWSDRATDQAAAVFGDHVDILRERVWFLRSARRFDEAFAALARAEALAPDDLGLICDRGALLIDTGEPDRALAYFAKAVGREPRRIQALRGVGQAHQAAKRTDEALAAYKHEVDAVPESALSHIDLGAFLCWVKCDAGAAETQFREAIRLEPGLSDAYYNLGNALEAKRDLDGAAAAFRDAIRLNDYWGAPHNNLGNVLLHQGNVDGAIEQYRQAIRLVPGYAQAHFNLAVALMRDQKVDDAIASCNAAIRIDAKFADAYITLGKLLERNGDLDGAMKAQLDAIRIDDSRSRAHDHLGDLLRKTHHLADSERELRKATLLDERNAHAWYHLGVTLLEMKDCLGAKEAFGKSIVLDPHDAIAFGCLGNALNEAGDRAGAIEAFRKGIALDDKLACLHFDLGRVLRDAHETKHAFEEFDRAVALDEKDADAWNERGCVLEDLGDLDEALVSFERAAACDRDDPAYPLNSGELLLDLRRDWRGALPFLARAVAHASKNECEAEAHHKYGKALFFASRLDEALQEMTRAVDLDSTNDRHRMYLWEILTALGRHAEALAAAKDAYDHLPGKSEFAWRATLSLASLGRTADAREFASISLSPEPDPADVFDFAYLCVLAGREGDARAWLAKGAALDGDGDAYQRSCVCAALGDREDALHWIAVAARKGYFQASLSPLEPAFDLVKDEPRFKLAMEKIVVR